MNQPNQLSLDQAYGLLHNAINEPETIKGGKAVDLHRAAVNTFVQAVNDSHKENADLKAKLEAHAKEIANMEHRLQAAQAPAGPVIAIE